MNNRSEGNQGQRAPPVKSITTAAVIDGWAIALVYSGISMEVENESADFVTTVIFGSSAHSVTGPVTFGSDADRLAD